MLYLNYLDNTQWQILSLRPQCLYTSSSFLFRAIEKDSKSEYLFYAHDFSTSEYYSRFNIQSATSSDDMNGVIDAPPGQYTLEVYESIDDTFDYRQTVGKINVDILNIVGTHSNIETYDNQGTPINVYRNQDRV